MGPPRSVPAVSGPQPAPQPTPVCPLVCQVLPQRETIPGAYWDRRGLPTGTQPGATSGLPVFAPRQPLQLVVSALAEVTAAPAEPETHLLSQEGPWQRQLQLRRGCRSRAATGGTLGPGSELLL